MANAKKQKGILVISKEKLDCYIEGSTGILSLPFPPHIIRSMEVMDRPGLSTYIHTFVTTNKIIPGILTLIIHESLLFEKLLTIHTQQVTAPTAPSSTQPVVTPQLPAQPATAAAQPVPVKPVKQSLSEVRDEEEALEQQFIDSVPFEEVFVKSIKTAAGKLLIVTNKDLILAIKEAFEKDGYTIENVYPITIFGKDVIPASGLTVQTALQLLTKQETQHGQNMLEKPAEAQVGPVAMGLPKKDSEKKRLYLMIGVFVMLIGILVFFYTRMMAENAALSKPLPPPAVVETPVVEVISPTVSLPASSSAAMKQAVAISIAFSQRRSSQSAALQTSFRSKGYQSISVQPGTTQNTVPLITFSLGVPQDIKDEITQTLLSLDSTTVVQENAGTGSTVVISY